MQRKPKHPKDTTYFHYYNANSHNRKTSDCVLRAISTVMEQPWEVTFDELAIMSRKTGYMMNDSNVWIKYLESKGFVKKNEPRTQENKKIKICDFIKENPNLTAVVKIGTRHLAAVINGVVYDIWDSSTQILHTYYVKEE